MLRRVIGEGFVVLVNLSHGMADFVSYGNVERDIEQVLSSFSVYLIQRLHLYGFDLHEKPFLVVLQALIALKKGTQLLKYGRKGKPKFCPFRLSNVSVISLEFMHLIWVRTGNVVFSCHIQGKVVV